MNFFEKQTNHDTMLASLREDLAGRRLHDLSFGTMYTYKDIPKLLPKANGLFHLVGNYVVTEASVTRKSIFWLRDPTADELREWMSKGFSCTTEHKIEGVSGSSKRVEVEYDLRKVFDPASYPNAKKRYQRITYPINFLEKEGISIRMLSGEPEIEAALVLHDRWMAIKRANPAIHQNSLPSARYSRCVRYASNMPKDLWAFGAWKGDELIAVRVFGVSGVKAFDLAFYSDYQNLPSQTTEYLNTALMKILLALHVETLNSGLSSDKGLKTFKNHYPNEEVVSYSYKEAKK